MDTGQSFKDLLGSMFNPDGGFGEEEEDEDEDDRY
jgi:magnesium chelatase subunit I